MHVIRLRKPWTRILSDGGVVDRVDVPDGDSFDCPPSMESQAEIAVVYSRRFNRPSGVRRARVYLRITGWHGRLDVVTLNEHSVAVGGDSHVVHAEITSLLRSHNELKLRLVATVTTPPRLTGEVELGIEEDDCDSVT